MILALAGDSNVRVSNSPGWERGYIAPFMFIEAEQGRIPGID